jgi:hypothetical protein
LERDLRIVAHGAEKGAVAAEGLQVVGFQKEGAFIVLLRRVVLFALSLEKGCVVAVEGMLIWRQAECFLQVHLRCYALALVLRNESETVERAHLFFFGKKLFLKNKFGIAK